MPTTLECRRSEDFELHALVRRGLPALGERLEQAERGLPRHVERTVQRFLACGDPTEGFAWLKCAPCDHRGGGNSRGTIDSCGG